MKTLSRHTVALLLAAPCLLMADGEGDLSTHSTSQQCDEPVTYRGSSNPGATSPAAKDTNLILGKVGFNVIDSFTGNAWRRVRDLSFPNAVGGLTFERIHVTRATNITTSFGVFGQESGWLHNWQYIIRDYGVSAPTDPYPNQPIIRIGLPDGRGHFLHPHRHLLHHLAPGRALSAQAHFQLGHQPHFIQSGFLQRLEDGIREISVQKRFPIPCGCGGG